MIRIMCIDLVQYAENRLEPVVLGDKRYSRIGLANEFRNERGPLPAELHYVLYEKSGGQNARSSEKVWQHFH